MDTTKGVDVAREVAGSGCVRGSGSTMWSGVGAGREDGGGGGGGMDAAGGKGVAWVVAKAGGG